MKKSKVYEDDTQESSVSQLDMPFPEGQTGTPMPSTSAESESSSVGEEPESKNIENTGPEIKNNYRPKTKIDKSSLVIAALQRLDSPKLSQLYSSLCQISLIEHPVLMSVGSWSFFETLARLLGARNDMSFSAFFNGKINEWYQNDKNKRTMYKKILADISERGNLDKHEGRYYTVDAKQLAVDFSIAEPLILEIIEEIIAENSVE